MGNTHHVRQQIYDTAPVQNSNKNWEHGSSYSKHKSCGPFKKAEHLCGHTESAGSPSVKGVALQLEKYNLCVLSTG